MKLDAAGAVWVEIPVRSGWCAAQRLALQNGRVVIAEMRLVPDERSRRAAVGTWSGRAESVPQAGVTRQVLQRVPMTLYGDVLRDFVEAWSRVGGVRAFGTRPLIRVGATSTTRKRSQLTGEQNRILQALSAVVPEAAQELLPAPSGRGRKRVLDERFFRRVAAAYRRFRRTQPNSPSAATAKHFGASRTTARNWIYRARRMGLLGTATWGRAGEFSIRRALTSR